MRGGHLNKNKFNKISFAQYERDNIRELIEEWELEEEYLNIQLPKRATKYSAGYDFFAPFSFELAPSQTILIPTGIRMEIEKDKYLQIVPRSSLGFKYRFQLDNILAVIDSDYANASNEGHIMLKMTNCSLDKTKVLKVNRGDGICQGIISPYYLTEDDEMDYKQERGGGFGSTDKKNA